MTNAQEPSDDGEAQDAGSAESQPGGRSGEGAASAMQQLISQNRQHRHQTGDADDAAGGHGS